MKKTMTWRPSIRDNRSYKAVVEKVHSLQANVADEMQERLKVIDLHIL